MAQATKKDMISNTNGRKIIRGNGKRKKLNAAQPHMSWQNGL